MSRSARCLVVLLASLAVMTGVLTGCSSASAADALQRPAKDVSSAVRAASLAVDLRMEDSTTAAASSTAVDDMLGEVESATHEVHGVKAPLEDERAVRNDLLASFSTISRALVHARDVLGAPAAGPGEGQYQLSAVRDELRVATGQLDRLMAKAGIQ
ncbi:hypothetical protein J2790_000177 [Paenarthrobacter nicotinovorans]|uniref:hypothetical protein n=1 Tax=Micrococcaceae TaxID=1268 RepID=UPI000876C959|nr:MULTISPECIES: hypothetical protein [Micrococcaceae]MDR6435056.1 hypothetical protein [Paenarthrobacter nicotinovorans]SCZ58978.1 hypothetical protein SAMN02799638_02595 [Arthrobacter sp. UNCCL28]